MIREVLVRRFLRRKRGRSVMVQCWGVVFRGRHVETTVEGLVLDGVSVLDEEKGPGADWQPMDGEVLIAGGAVRFVQVL